MKNWETKKKSMGLILLRQQIQTKTKEASICHIDLITTGGKELIE